MTCKFFRTCQNYNPGFNYKCDAFGAECTEHEEPQIGDIKDGD